MKNHRCTSYYLDDYIITYTFDAKHKKVEVDAVLTLGGKNIIDDLSDERLSRYADLILDDLLNI